MASIQRHGTQWRAFVARDGIRRSKVLPTLREAKDWAAREEHLIATGQGKYGPGTLGGLFDRYAREVSPKHKGERWEVIRLAKLSRDPIGAIPLGKLSPPDFVAWRERRLKEVKPSSVARDMELVRAVISKACGEWALLSVDPMRTVKKPPKPDGRTRRVSDDECEAILALTKPPGIGWRVAMAFRFAVETGMRAGEIAGLRREHINGRVAHLPDTKNGTSRDVPLSWAALAILCALPPSPNVFALTPRQIDATFRKLRDKAGIEGLTFHDSRGEAATRLSARLDAFELARVLGHKSLNMTLRYYRATAEQIAEKVG